MARRRDDDDDDLKPRKKKAAKRRGKDDDEELPKTKGTVFTGIALLTFLALATAGTFFYLDFEERSLPEKQLAFPEVSISALLAKGTAVPVRPAPVPPVVPAPTP